MEFCVLNGELVKRILSMTKEKLSLEGMAVLSCLALLYEHCPTTKFLFA